MSHMTLDPTIRVELVEAHHRRVLSTASLRLTPSVQWMVGREGDTQIGLDPLDTGVSRSALTVAATESGWVISVDNRRGAWLHLWGQPASRLEPGTTILHEWPRIGIRVIGKVRDVEHWVLLECSQYSLPDLTPAICRTELVPSGTDLADAPPALTESQMEAVLLVFEQHLAWPPISNPEPRSLAAVGKRLGISGNAVSIRLDQVRHRARPFGLNPSCKITDPEYVYVLLKKGYITSRAV